MGTREAIEQLKARHPKHIAWGLHLAMKMAKKNNTVHSRELLLEMIRLKKCDPNMSAHFIGAVFKTLRDEGLLKWTGHYYKYSDAERNIHDREIKLWCLNIPETQVTAYDEEPS